MTDIRAFENLANEYDNFRPGYLPEILESLREFIASGGVSSGHIIDVGAGTGISTRALAAVFGQRYCVTGLEPCLPMLQKAILYSKTDNNIAYVVGAAENLPAHGKSACLVATAQSVHWFDRPVFYREAARVLQRDGGLAILQNNRDWQKSAFLEAYEEFLEKHSEHYSRYYRSFDIAAELGNLRDFEVAEPISKSWDRRMNVDDFIGLSLSSTKTKNIVRRIGRKQTERKIRDLARKYHPKAEILSVPYKTELYLARCRR